MLSIKLRILNKISKIKTQNRVNKISRMKNDSSVAWTVTAFVLKTFSLTFFGAIILFPFFFMISNSLLSETEAMDPVNSYLVPKEGLHWENFAHAFREGYWSALLITLTVTALSIVLKILLTMTMGYGFSYNKWWGKSIIWYILIAMMMIPEIALLVGQYLTVVRFDMHVGNQVIISMFLPFIAQIFSAFMFRNAFLSIPNRIKEAAIVNGASEFKYFWKVAVPMITPTVWTVIIFTAFASWNSYMWPQILITGSGNPKHVLGTWLFTTGKVGDGTEQRLLTSVRLAAAILITIPMFVIYFIFRRHIMNAISRQGSAIKG